jgi:non-specific serine/threonine protein kinase
LTVEQLADRLEHDPRILSGLNRGGPARHQTIRATIDWSHEMLGEREQILLRRLSVFAGGWTLDMAETVCRGAGIERPAVLDVLAQLVDKSMVVVHANASTARYHLLEPIRQYALERLEEAGEGAEYRSRHAEAVLSLAQSGEVDDYGPGEVARLAHLEAEHANLRVALRWSLDNHQHEAGLRAASALFRFWERRSHFQEGCAWLEEALEGAPDAAARDRGWALNALAFLYWRAGDPRRAQPVAELALAVNGDVNHTLALAWALGNLGAIAYYRDQPQVAVCWLEESVALGRQAGYSPFLSLALAFLGRSLLALTGPADSRVSRVLQESLALAEAAEARYAIGHASMALGDLYWRSGRVDRAVPHWRRALTVRSDIADRRGITDALERLAWRLATAQQFESAAWLFGAIDAQVRLLGIELRHDEAFDHTDLLDDARQHLGDGFARAWGDGEASTVEEAVTLALEVTRCSDCESEPRDLPGQVGSRGQQWWHDHVAKAV